MSMTRRWTHAELDIPTQFEVLNHQFQVLLDHTPDTGMDGLTDFGNNTIRLFTQGNSRSALIHTYYHELGHVLLYYAGHPALSEDETLVDVLGGLLAQVIGSSTSSDGTNGNDSI
jgi:hypothetical protein